MQLPKPLHEGILIRRYKRFLADILLANGETVTAHCPNSGSMIGCAIPGLQVLLSRSINAGRKLPFTWELVKVNGSWVGINTQLPNKLVHEAIGQGIIQELAGYESIRPEIRVGTNSRIDLLLSGPAGQCYVEVKNVTLVEGAMALFPDAKTERGRKHLHELIQLVKNGCRGVIFFVVQREDSVSMAPADKIDPEYGRDLRLAVANGVEALAYQARVGPETIRLHKRLPISLHELSAGG